MWDRLDPHYTRMTHVVDLPQVHFRQRSLQEEVFDVYRRITPFGDGARTAPNAKASARRQPGARDTQKRSSKKGT